MTAQNPSDEDRARRDIEQMKSETEDMRRGAGNVRREAAPVPPEAVPVEPAAPEAPVAAEAAAEKSENIYVVQSGDTLSGIAASVYGQAGRWREIYEANKDVIDNPSVIRPGWKLRIPG